MQTNCKQNFENQLRFDKVTESLKVGTFFETQCRNSTMSRQLKPMTTQPQIMTHTTVRQRTIQTMRQDTLIVKKVTSRFRNQIVNGYDTIYIHRI